MISPSEFPRRVLFSVTGLTPQVVTETIYALAANQSPVFVPTELIVMTTSDGASRVRLTLQGTDPGWLGRLCGDYDLPPIRFGTADLRVLHGREGASLPDIRSDDDNKAAADAIIETIQELTADPDCALHVSMAGGRKTLGFFAAYALSLYGRAQDRLSHVLVSPEFEASQDFYYPTRYSRVIYDRNGTPLDTKDAKVALADIPFVRMRTGLPEALRVGQTSYSRAVDVVQDYLRPPSLMIDLQRQSVVAGGQPIKMRPISVAYYAWIARHARAGRKLARTAKHVHERDMTHAREFLAEYGKLVDLIEHPTINETMGNGLQHDFFDQQRSKLNRELRKVLDVGADAYLVHSFGPRRQATYGLTLPPEVVTIIG